MMRIGMRRYLCTSWEKNSIFSLLSYNVWWQATWCHLVVVLLVSHQPPTCKPVSTTCDKRKHRNDLLHGIQSFLPMDYVPFRTICANYMGPLPRTSNGNKHIIVVVDIAIRFCEAKAGGQRNAEITIKFLFNLQTVGWGKVQLHWLSISISPLPFTISKRNFTTLSIFVSSHCLPDRISLWWRIKE